MEIIEGHRPAQTFIVEDLVTVSRTRLAELEQKEKAYDDMYLEVMQSQHALSAKLREMRRMK